MDRLCRIGRIVGPALAPQTDHAKPLSQRTPSATRNLLCITVALAAILPFWGSMGMAEPQLTLKLSGAPASRAAAVSGATPVLVPPSSMKVQPGQTADQLIYATDTGGDPLAFVKGSAPEYMTVGTIDPGAGLATGNIHLAPPMSAEIGAVTASVIVTDGVLSDEKSFVIVSSDNPPALLQPQDMEVEAGRTTDQTLNATDPDNDALTFSLTLGPWFVTVSTTGPRSGNVHLTPTLADSGVYRVTVAVSDGLASDYRTSQVTVPSKTTPMLAQPPDLTVRAGQSITQALSATDPDGERLSFYKVDGPSYMHVGTYASPSAAYAAYGYVNLAPQPSDSPTPAGGTFAIRAVVGVTDGTRSDTKFFTVNVTFPPDHPPVLGQPADMTAKESHPISQELNTSDPDGDMVAFSKASGPSFMTVGPGPWYGTPEAVYLEPGYADAGLYTATVQVTDTRGLSDGKSFRITVENVLALPQLDRPVDMIAFVGQVTEQVIHARDPDGNPVSFTKYRGPTYMSVTTTDPGAGYGTGKIRLLPGETDLGPATGSVWVADASLSAYASFAITVFPPAQPVLLRIADIYVYRGSADSVTIRAIDPEGDPLSFSQSGLPHYATLTDNGDGTARIALNPQPTDPLGDAIVTVGVSDGTLSASQAFVVHLCWTDGFDGDGGWDGDRPPYARPGGPYTGQAGTPVTFDGSASSDPEGQPLRFVWNLGDGAIGEGALLAHTYARAGRFTVELLVTDGLLSARDSATATIASAGSAPHSGTPGRIFRIVRPNPIRNSATVLFDLPAGSAVSISVLDVQGRGVRHLHSGRARGGLQEIEWDGRTDGGEPAREGIYFIQLRTDSGNDSRKITILR